MALTVAELQVELEAKTAQFNTRLSAAERKLTKFGTAGTKNVAKVQSSLGGLARAAGPALAALASFATVAFFARASKDAAQFLDVIGKTADSVGVTTTFLQEFRTAVSLTGGGVADADKALQRLNRNVAEAQEGIGPAAEAFQALGISIGSLSDLDTPQILNLIADRLENVESSAQKSQLSFDLFGRAGQVLVNTLRGGSAGLRDLTTAARESGTVIDESLIRRAEALNDRLELVNARLRNETLPVLIDFRQGVVEITSGLSRFIGFLTSIGEAPPLAAAFSFEDLARTNRELGDLETQIGAINARIEEGGGLSALGPGGDEVVRGLKSQRDQLILSQVDLERRRATLFIQRREEERLANAIDETNEALGGRPEAPPIITPADVALTEQAANVERNRIREAFFRQQEIERLREEAIGAELADIETAKQAETEAEKLRIAGITEAKRLEDELLRTRQMAAQTLLQLQRQLRDEAEAGGDPLILQAQAQRDAIEEAARAAGQAVSPEAQQAAGEVLAALTERRRQTLEQINFLAQTNAQIQEQLEARAQRILVLDEARGQALLRQLEVIRNANLSLEEQRQALLDLVTEPPVPEEGAVVPFAESFGQALTQGFIAGFDEAEGDLFDGFLNTIETATSQAFLNAQGDITKVLSDAVTDGLSGIGSALGLGESGGVFGQVGDFLGTEAGQAALGFGVAAIKALRTETETSARAATGITSAVTSVQQVRGLVAGPTQIAVAQVDRGIRDAFIPSELLLRRIEANTRATASNSRPSGGGSINPAVPGNEATDVLVSESQSLV